ncbi:MAG: MFS transporter, partial [Chloroflexota bacterium]
MTAYQDEKTPLPLLGGFSLREVSILGALMIPTLMSLISTGMLGVALPIIQAEFTITVDALSLVIAAGFLLRVPFMSIYGRVGDSFGKKKLYLVGLTVVVGGSLVSGLSQSFSGLLIGRTLEGLGGAASLPLAMALVVDTLPEERRGRGLGIWNSAAPLGMVLGPVIGGFMVEIFGWRSIFLVFAAGTLIAIVVVLFLVPNKVPVKQPLAMDWAGATAWAIFLGALLAATSTSSFIPFWTPLNLMFWSISFGAVLFLGWNALQRDNAFIPLEIFKNRRFMMPALAIMLRMFTLEGVRFLTILYLANVFLQSPSQTGLIMGFFTVPLLVGVTYGGFLADRWSARKIGIIAMSGMTVSLIWLGLVNGESTGYLILAPGLIMSAFFTAICLAAFSKTSVSSLGPEQVGLASGLYNTIRFAGLAVSTPLLGAWLARGFSQYGGLESISWPY